MFHKVGESGQAAVVRDPRAVALQVFASLGASEAPETAVRRMAKRYGLDYIDLSPHCRKLPNGNLTVAHVQ